MSLRFRRHVGLIVLLALVAGALVLAAGNQPIVAYTAQAGALAALPGAGYGGEAALLAGLPPALAGLLVH